MGVGTLVSPPTRALLDHFRPKPILIAGNLASALGYADLAFVERPWQRSLARSSTAPAAGARDPRPLIGPRETAAEIDHEEVAGPRVVSVRIGLCDEARFPRAFRD